MIFFKIDFFAISKVLVRLSAFFGIVVGIPKRVVLTIFRKFWKFCVSVVDSISSGHLWYQAKKYKF